MRKGHVIPLTLEATGDVEPYSVLVAGTTNKSCKLPAAAKADKVIGIMLPVFNQSVAVNGDIVEVQVGEVTEFRKATGDSSVVQGVYLMPGDALGNLTALTCAAGETNEYIGIALETLESTDLEGEMLVVHGMTRLPS